MIVHRKSNSKAIAITASHLKLMQTVDDVKQELKSRTDIAENSTGVSYKFDS